MNINCRGKLIDLKTPKVMGIVNITPDSFFSGSRHEADKELVKTVAKMLAEGADIIDIGGYSTRPGANNVSPAEELLRVIPAIERIVAHFPDVILSVDTFRSEVANQAVAAGAAIVNDVSAGLLDDKMLSTVAGLRVPYIMMHMRGTPQTMMQLTGYDDLVSDILLYFSERIKAARSVGISDIVVDPGFGFSKTTEQNFELLGKMDLMQIAGQPIIVGLSRKSMVYKPLNLEADAALTGTTVVNTLALSKGASILRVHDVKEAVQCVKLFLMSTGFTGGDRVHSSKS